MGINTKIKIKIQHSSRKLLNSHCPFIEKCNIYKITDKFYLWVASFHVKYFCKILRWKSCAIKEIKSVEWSALTRAPDKKKRK